MKKDFTRVIASMLLLSFCSTAMHAGETENNDSQTSGGHMIVHLFTHYSMDISSKVQNAGFDFSRAYLGYHYDFNENLSGRIVVDAAVPEAGSKRHSIYLKNAFVTWTNRKFTVDAGLLCLRQFIHTQENWWEKRYVTNSLTDRTGMFNGADYGIDFVYAPSDKVSLDFTFTNGEGFKSLNRNTSFKYDLGVVWRPASNLVFRYVGEWYTKASDLIPSTYSGKTSDQFLSTVFFGAQYGKFKIGAEGGYLWNKNFINRQDMWCYSVYTIYRFAEKFNAFLRFDQVGSYRPEQVKWNSTDGTLALGGIEYMVNGKIKVSPNIRNLCDGNIRNSKTYLFVSLEFKL